MGIDACLEHQRRERLPLADLEIYRLVGTGTEALDTLPAFR